MFSVQEILDIAIMLEKNGESVYRKALPHVRDKKLCALLEWIADEEVRHARWFAELKALSKEDDEFFIQEMQHELLDEYVGRQTFSLEDIDFSKITKLDDMVKLFIEFEQDTILFYEMLEAFVEKSDALVQLRQIIDEEYNHTARLKIFIS
ncbi:MAG: ferritin family protein [Desulfobacterales bacterium]|nr:ferritin family protein [Desulfobacterales bacterium]